MHLKFSDLKRELAAKWVTTNWGSTVLMVTTETPKSDVIVEFGIFDGSVNVTCLPVMYSAHCSAVLQNFTNRRDTNSPCESSHCYVSVTISNISHPSQVRNISRSLVRYTQRSVSVSA